MINFAFWTPGPIEMVILGIVVVLIFGKNLPKVAKSFGAAIPSFKKGIAEANQEVAEVQAQTVEIQKNAQDALKEVTKPLNEFKQAVTGQGAAQVRRKQENRQQDQRIQDGATGYSHKPLI